MRCLTDSETSAWLLEREIAEDPYRSDESPGHYLQFHAPVNYRRTDAFIRHYYEKIIPESRSLVHMTDWGLYTPSEMVAIMGVRSTAEETRILIEAPGHIIESAETEVGISLFSLSASFQWSSYLYSPKGRSALYNWEGEIFDFWTACDDGIAEMETLLKEFDLPETTEAERAGALQPTTALDSKSEGNENPKPESEARSQ